MVKRTCRGCGCEVEAKATQGPPPKCAACREAGETPCKIDGCGNIQRAMGWCKTHYSRWRTHGDPVAPRLKMGPAGRVGCLVENCDRKHHRQGYCRLHFNRLQARGSTHYAPAALDPCGFEGCDRVVGLWGGGRGFCALHLKRLRKYGDPRGVRLDCGICGAGFFPVNSNRKVCDTCMETCVRQCKVPVAELAERDGTACGLCREPVDMDLNWPDLWCPTVDHIIPWSLGGTHARENLQLAHFVCNVRKGNRVAT